MRASRAAAIIAVVAVLAACGDDPLRTQPEPVEPRVDLVAEAVVGPAAAPVGGIVEYEVGLRNGGGERAEDGWYIRVYLSEDPMLDAGDMLVDQFATRRALAPGAADGYARVFKVPGSTEPGQYHLVSELDATGVYDEPLEDNNARASDGRIRIEAAGTGF